MNGDGQIDEAKPIQRPFTPISISPPALGPLKHGQPLKLLGPPANHPQLLTQFSVDQLSMPPPSLTPSEGHGSKQGSDGHHMSVNTHSFKEPRDSFGSQGSIDSPKRGVQLAPGEQAVFSEADLDDARLLSLLGMLASPSQSSASAGQAACAGEVVDSLRRSSNGLSPALLKELGSPTRAAETAHLQTLASLQKMAPQTSSLLSALRSAGGPPSTQPITPGEPTSGGLRSIADRSPMQAQKTPSRPGLPKPGVMFSEPASSHAGPAVCQGSSSAQPPQPTQHGVRHSGRLARLGSDWRRDTKDLDSILKSSELSAKQEAALLAHCRPVSEAVPDFASPVNKIREESMLAGLGVIAPNEIGITLGSGSQGKPGNASDGGLLAELRQQKAGQLHKAAAIGKEPQVRGSDTKQAPLSTASQPMPVAEPPLHSSGGAQRPDQAGAHLVTRSEAPLGRRWSPQGTMSGASAGSPGTLEVSSGLQSSLGQLDSLGLPRRPSLEARGRNILVAPSSPLYEFGSGRLAAKAAGQDLPAMQPQEALPSFVAGVLSPKSPIASRASSPALSTFGSGGIASGVARGNSLQSRHSSPVRLGSGSGLSSAGEGDGRSWRSPRSPPLSFNGGLQPAAMPSGTEARKPNALADLQAKRAQETSEGPRHALVHNAKRSVSPEALKAYLPRKRVLPVIPSSIFSREDAPGWRPPPSPPGNAGSSPVPEEHGNPRFWTVHSLNSWAHGDRNSMLQSRRSSLHSKSSIQSQPSFHSWAGPGSGLENSPGSRLWSKVNNSGTLEFIRQPPMLGDSIQLTKENMFRSPMIQQQPDPLPEEHKSEHEEKNLLL